MATPLEIHVPPANATVTVSIIDTTSWGYQVECGDLFRPQFEGLGTFDLCSYAFLITHGKRHVPFDLGIRKDWKNLIPSTVKRLKDSGTMIKVEKELVSILNEGGTDLDKIDDVVWSNIYWDHTGNLASFPQTADFAVGPSIKDRFLPGWPAVPDSHFHELDVAGRNIVGLETNDFNVDIGGLLGYVGDGSFYLLDAPGHSLGHMNAFAGTSADPATFIFIAADSVHLGGEIRPSEALPLPDVVDIAGVVPRHCPVESLCKFHLRNSRTLPYLGLDLCFSENPEDAEKTIESVQWFNADERILVIFAHVVSIYNMLEYYLATAND